MAAAKKDNDKDKRDSADPASTSLSNPPLSNLLASSNLRRRHLRFGWTTLFVAMAFGTVLEGFLGFKSPHFVQDELRRELWSLAHFHAALLALVNLIYAVAAGEPPREGASRSLLAGSILLPLGFLLGGLSHPEGDPSAGIFLVPAGALLVLYAIFVQARGAWKPPKS